jgi:hypothetical protein
MRALHVLCRSICRWLRLRHQRSVLRVELVARWWACRALRWECCARRWACEDRRPPTSTHRCVGRARGIGGNGGGSGAVCESGGGAGGTSGMVCCAGGSVWSGVVCCATKGEAKNPNAKVAQTNVARCMGGSDVFTITIAAAEGSSTGPSAEFSGAEARPVSCACASVCGERWSADLSFGTGSPVGCLRTYPRLSSAAAASSTSSWMIAATGSSRVTMPTDWPAMTEPLSTSPSITARRSAPAQ